MSGRTGIVIGPASPFAASPIVAQVEPAPLRSGPKRLALRRVEEQERGDHQNQHPKDVRPHGLAELALQKVLGRSGKQILAPPAYAYGAAAANPDRILPVGMCHQAHVADGPSAPFAIRFRRVKVYFTPPSPSCPGHTRFVPKP
jgi:hypothetical protein